MVTVVYAFNTREERKGLWTYLETVKIGNNLAWIVMGDFNSVVHADDRIGGNPVSMTEIVDFQACVEECELVKLHRQGNNYTWNDKGDVRVFSKIDWVFVNDE